MLAKVMCSVCLDKESEEDRYSDWEQPELTEKQQDYGAVDVLLPLNLF